MKLPIKIITLFLSQLAGFIAAVSGYEALKIAFGMPYSEPLWGIDIPFIYQTEKIYTIYCLGLSVWFLLLCITGVIASLKNKKILPLIISVLIILSIFLVIFLNGRYEL